MTYIKKLMMYGFKSFPRKIELPFTAGINTIVGPNGSGKSNISDALCFVLGRLSIKSLRASKAGNLIFMGSKIASPSREAIVEVVFDNSSKEFFIEESEISIKRIVRRNGQSIYQINGRTKTRQEVLTLLAQAGIDPNGFNIVLQGEIQNFVRMQSEERRKIIEEVAGISIYESRKEKSLKELEKTEDKLKEINAILRERTSYLNNLEKEREEALKYKKLEKEIKDLKASIIISDLNSRLKEKESIDEEILKKRKEIEKFSKIIISINSSIESFESKILEINTTIKESTGLEQERLNDEIANIRAEIAAQRVKLENYERKISETRKNKEELSKIIDDLENKIIELQKESPNLSKKEKEVKIKKQELEKLEEKRKKFYVLKSELKSLKERIQDKKNLLFNYENESAFLLRQIDSFSLELFDKKTDAKRLEIIQILVSEKKQFLENIKSREKELEKLIYVDELEIEKEKKIIEKISKIDICPLCRSKITHEHMSSIKSELSPKIISLEKQIQTFEKELVEIISKKEFLTKEIDGLDIEISRRKTDIVKLNAIEDKKNQIKNLQEKTESLKKELIVLEKSHMNIEEDFSDISRIEEKCASLRIEIEEISLRNRENLDSEISFKQRDLERSEVSLKQFLREEKDLIEEFELSKKILSEKEESLLKKKKQEEELTKRFQSLLSQRDALQLKIRGAENELSENKNKIQNIEQLINSFKIDLARLNAEIENLESDLNNFQGYELIKMSRDNLVLRLTKSQESFFKIGNANLKALEVYDSVKQEYDKVKEKCDVIINEKEKILKIIHEIDVKKRKTFLRTLEQLNEVFSRNFAQLSTKGQVSLSLENQKSPFEGGVDVIVKTGHGKYFDVKSLSGGEQTLVALSLIFAIQELKPYSFYILDEIDAALDKRNSERLGNLLKRYMQKGQYIVITHNDEIITNSTNLYGVSMHDGVSKIISMKIN
jgi:chromosome segregation protein